MTLAILPTPLAPLAQQALLPKMRSELESLSDASRLRMQLRRVLVKLVEARMDQGAAPRDAAHHISTLLQLHSCSEAAQTAFVRLGEPAARTLETWVRDYQAQGDAALVDARKGRVRKAGGWEARAMALYAQPQRPGYSTVALWLQQEGFGAGAGFKAFAKRVERYLKSLPSNKAETAPKRLGAHFYAQNVRPHKVRDTSTLPVGFIYEGDGHCCDVYVAAPATGTPYRPELTVWLDIRSQAVVGWWLSESESAESTLFSLSHALISHNHAPAYVHTDPGSGFKARLISDSDTGFLARFSIEAITALPGNAKGKGLTEGWFRWFEERCGKRFESFCGHCRTDDQLSRLRERVKRGELRLPSLAEYAEAVRSYLAFYNANPQQELGCAPNDLWQQLERVPLELPDAAVICPRKSRTVRRWGVQLDNRLYRAAGLQALEGRDCIVEYSLHNDTTVRCFDTMGRYLCDAQLVEKTPWLPESRIVEGQQRRLAGQAKRLQVHLDEMTARARAPLVSSPADLLAISDDSAALATERTAAINQALTAEAAQASDIPDTPRARYALWQQRSAAGAPDDWCQSYESTSEFRGQHALHQFD